MSAQEVYIISFHATHGDNHWAFFIPHPSTPHRGVYINAAGNPFQGFSVVIEGNRDLELEFTRHWLTSLGHVSVSTEVLKEFAREIKAPGISPRPLEPSPNCQTWMREYVGKLVEEGILEIGAVEAMNTARRNRDG